LEKIDNKFIPPVNYRLQKAKEEIPLPELFRAKLLLLTREKSCSDRQMDTLG